MPTYDYECRACGHAFELFQSMTEPVKKKCPQCGKLRLERLIGIGAGVIFKGGGFYETDYRSESYRKAAEADKSAASSSSGSSDSSGSKSADGNAAAAAGSTSSKSGGGDSGGGGGAATSTGTKSDKGGDSGTAKRDAGSSGRGSTAKAPATT